MDDVVAEVGSFRLTNYRMAAGRVGLAMVLVPILFGVGLLFLVDPSGNRPIGGGLILLAIPFVWYACSVPVSVTIDEVVSVRYLWGRRIFLASEILQVETGVIKTRLLQRMANPHAVRPRIYQTVIIKTTMGNRICLLGDREQATRIQAAIERIQSTTGGAE